MSLKSDKLLSMVLAFACSFIFLLALGVWQLERLTWKNNLLQRLSNQLELPAAKLSFDIVKDINRYEFRKIITNGTYSFDNSITIYSKVHEGYVGRDLIVPLETEYGWILVNKGFIPEKNYRSYLKEGQSNLIHLEGLVKIPRKKSYFTPENNFINGEWYYINIDDIREFTGLPLLNFLIIENIKNKSEKFPIPREEVYRDIPNNHLQYSLTWFSLAIVLFFIVRAFWNKNIKV